MILFYVKKKKSRRHARRKMLAFAWYSSSFGFLARSFLAQLDQWRMLYRFTGEIRLPAVTGTFPKYGAKTPYSMPFSADKMWRQWYFVCRVYFS